MVELLANVVEIEVASQRLHVLLITVGEDVRNKIRQIGNCFVRGLVPDRSLGERQQFGIARQELHLGFSAKMEHGQLVEFNRRGSGDKAVLDLVRQGPKVAIAKIGQRFEGDLG